MVLDGVTKFKAQYMKHELWVFGVLGQTREFSIGKVLRGLQPSLDDVTVQLLDERDWVLYDVGDE